MKTMSERSSRRATRIQPASRPKLGQHFLTSPITQSAIADALGDLSHGTVVEIGPGRGAITSILAARARRLIAIELDRDLAAQLREQFRDLPSVTILEQDILKTDLAALAEDARAEAAAPVAQTKNAAGATPARGAGEAGLGNLHAETAAPVAHTKNAAGTNQERRAGEAGLRIVGNLPYYITSDILLHLFAAHSAIERAVLMIQREVAVRVAAPPGTSDYGLLSATAQLYARVETLFTLPPADFTPPPQVHSTVLRLTMAPRFGELGIDALAPAPEPFLAFLRAGFAQKRKMLPRNLRNAGYSPEAIAAAFAACAIDPQARAEQIDLATMARLYHRLSQAAGREKAVGHRP